MNVEPLKTAIYSTQNVDNREYDIETQSMKVIQNIGR